MGNCCSQQTKKAAPKAALRGLLSGGFFKNNVTTKNAMVETLQKSLENANKEKAASAAEVETLKTQLALIQKDNENAKLKLQGQTAEIFHLSMATAELQGWTNGVMAQCESRPPNRRSSSRSQSKEVSSSCSSSSFFFGLVGLHHQPVTLLKILAHQGIHPIPPHT